MMPKKIISLPTANYDGKELSECAYDDHYFISFHTIMVHRDRVVHNTCACLK